MLGCISPNTLTTKLGTLVGPTISFKQFLSKRSIQSCLDFLANRFCNFFLSLPLQVKILGNGNSSQNAKEYEHHHDFDQCETTRAIKMRI